MQSRLEYIQTATWHRIMQDLAAAGFMEVYHYAGMDAGIDYQRYDLINPADRELIICEWDNWAEGSIQALPSRLAALREDYQLSMPTQREG